MASIKCGDFNLVQIQDLDTSDYTNINNLTAKENVMNLKEEMNLVDQFRKLYGISKQYIWRKRNPLKQARLDFFLVSEALMSSIDYINIISSSRSDHSSVVLSLVLNRRKKEDTVELQRDIYRLGSWARKWGMRFQPVKCNMMQLTRKRIKKIHAAYNLEGTDLENVESIKYLGVTITSDLRWNTDVSNVCTKTNRTLGFLRRNLYSVTCQA